MALDTVLVNPQRAHLAGNLHQKVRAELMKPGLIEKLVKKWLGVGR